MQDENATAATATTAAAISSGEQRDKTKSYIENEATLGRMSAEEWDDRNGADENNGYSVGRKNDIVKEQKPAASRTSRADSDTPLINAGSKRGGHQCKNGRSIVDNQNPAVSGMAHPPLGQY
mmetsp:Transcript_2353/g.4366  ORF Transcript_2353/g.4366 Transcript_2353/m.4366 type:complete len:122 (+) Transcript_2353:358-723(+)